MKSKNGRPELVSLLQYMKNTCIDNPEIIVQDERIKQIDAICKAAEMAALEYDSDMVYKNWKESKK